MHGHAKSEFKLRMRSIVKPMWALVLYAYMCNAYLDCNEHVPRSGFDADHVQFIHEQGSSSESSFMYKAGL